MKASSYNTPDAAQKETGFEQQATSVNIMHCPFEPNANGKDNNISPVLQQTGTSPAPKPSLPRLSRWDSDGISSPTTQSLRNNLSSSPFSSDRDEDKRSLFRKSNSLDCWADKSVLNECGGGGQESYHEDDIFFNPHEFDDMEACNSKDNKVAATRRVVTFGKVYVRAYTRILGDTPTLTSGGPSLTLSWKSIQDLRGVPINDFERLRKGRRRLQILDRSTRERIVAEVASPAEIASAVRSNNRMRAQRRQTLNDLSMMSIARTVDMTASSQCPRKLFRLSPNNLQDCVEKENLNPQLFCKLMRSNSC